MEIKDPSLEEGDYVIFLHRHDEWQVAVFDNHDHPIGVFEDVPPNVKLEEVKKHMEEKAKKFGLRLEPDPFCAPILYDLVRD